MSELVKACSLFLIHLIAHTSVYFVEFHFISFLKFFLAMLFVHFNGKYINIIVVALRETLWLTGGLSDDELSLE